MAERALNAHRLQTAVLVDDACHADHGLQLEQPERGRRIVEIDFLLLELLLERVGQRIPIDLQSDRQGCLRTDAAAYAAILDSGDRFVQLQGIAPERFTPERVKAKDLPTLLDHVLGVLT